MLTHRTVCIVFIAVLAVTVLYNVQHELHWAWYVLLFALFSGIEFYGAYFVHSNYHLKTASSINTSERHIALTFDDGPMNGRTENVIRVLNKFNAKATFFCIGNRIKGNEALLRNIHEQGHLIGCHSYSHSTTYDFMQTKAMVNDMQLANSEIKRVIGVEPHFFRPPYGVTTPALARACKKMNYVVIGWNVRSLDTSIKDKKKLVERVKNKIQPGAIVLFHDTVENIDIVVEEVLIYLEQQNYKVVSLDTLIQKKAYV